jgi:Spore Coat Protein U domain.
MQQKTLVLILCGIASVANATCQITQVPNIQFSCPPTSAGSCAATNTLSLICSGETISGTLALVPQIVIHRGHYVPFQILFWNYNVYLDANQQQIFGNGAQATSTLNATCSGTCNYVLYSYTLGGNVQAGSYTDNLILTINY